VLTLTSDADMTAMAKCRLDRIASGAAKPLPATLHTTIGPPKKTATPGKNKPTATLKPGAKIPVPIRVQPKAPAEPAKPQPQAKAPEPVDKKPATKPQTD